MRYSSRNGTVIDTYSMSDLASTAATNDRKNLPLTQIFDDLATICFAVLGSIVGFFIWVISSNILLSGVLAVAIIVISGKLYYSWSIGQKNVFYVLVSVKPQKAKDFYGIKYLLNVYSSEDQTEAENLAQNIRACLTP
jgi:hypothetical protein